MMCVAKDVARFLSDPEFLALTRLNVSAPPCNEALYSQPMIVAVGLLGPLPVFVKKMVDQILTNEKLDLQTETCAWIWT